MSRRTAMRDPWVWGQVAMVAAVVAVLPAAAARWGVLDPAGPSRWLGLALILAGVAIASAGAVTLGPNLTPATEPLPSGQLVTRGIYRVVRHPIYLGVSTLLAGYGMLRGGWWAGVAAFAVALTYFELKARVEERFLVTRTAGYEEYRRRVPRILPGGWH
jgi:protein-S-isoprenylcysteine O-methyltransferase Ste14